MKVTLVNPRAIHPAPNKIAEALSQNGHEVKLLVWDRQGTLKGKNGDGYTICKFSLKAPYDKFTALFYLPIWWAYEFLFLLRDDSDVIHACDLTTLMPAIPAKLIKRVKLCYTIYDFYASNLPEGHLHLARKLIRSLVASVEKFGIRFAEVLFLPDECRYEEVRGSRINKLVYVYNSPSDYFEAKQEQELEATTEINIFYAGYLDESRGLEEVINAVSELADVKLTFAGTGPVRDIIEHNLAKLPNLQFIGQIPYEEVIRRELAADIPFAFYDPKIPSNRCARPQACLQRPASRGCQDSGV